MDMLHWCLCKPQWTQKGYPMMHWVTSSGDGLSPPCTSPNSAVEPSGRPVEAAQQAPESSFCLSSPIRILKCSILVVGIITILYSEIVNAVTCWTGWVVL